MAIDLDRLRPETNSRADLCAALIRCAGAGQIIAAEIARVRETRARLLMSGTIAELTVNATELATVMGEGTAVRDLAEHLQQLLQNYAVPVTPATPEQQAGAAAARFCTWWTTHGPEMIRGLTLMSEVAAAVLNWQAADPTLPDNVAPFTPRPVA